VERKANRIEELLNNRLSEPCYLGSFLVSSKGRVLVLKENRYYLFSLLPGSLASILKRVFPFGKVVFLQPTLPFVNKEFPFFTESAFAGVNAEDFKTAKYLKNSSLILSQQEFSSTLSLPTLTEEEKLFLSNYLYYLPRVKAEVEGEFIEVCLDGIKTKLPVPLFPPAKRIPLSLIEKGEIPVKESFAFPAEEETSLEIEEVKSSEEKIEKKISPKEAVFKRFLSYLSELTLTPFPYYLKVKEGEKEILPIVLAEFQIPFSGDGYYDLVEKVKAGKAEKKEVEVDNPRLKEAIVSYLKRKEARWALRKNGGVKSLKEIKEERFNRFLVKGDLKALKTAAAASVFLEEKDPKLLSYLREIFSVERLRELPERFLTGKEEAFESLSEKAEEFFESYYPGVEFPDIDPEELLKVRFRPSPPVPNVFYRFLISIDETSLSGKGREFLKVLKENFEGKDDPLYSFNFIV